MKRNWGVSSIYTALAIVIGALAAAPQMALADSSSALEERVKLMEQQLRELRQELATQRKERQTPDPIVQDLDSRIKKVEQAAREMPAGGSQVRELEERVARVERVKRDRKNMIFFRGGYTELREDRANQVFSDTFELLGRRNDSDEGWYVGAGIEHTLIEDLWGLAPGIDVLGEIMFEWKRINSLDDTDLNSADGAVRVVPAAVATLPDTSAPSGPLPDVLDGSASQTTAAGEAAGVTLSFFTLTAAPKVKFPEFYGIRPWIIPAGLAFHVISPPSNAGTVLTPGVMWAAGLDWTIWENVVFGVDGRYHLAADEADGVDVDHWTAGGYLGFRF